MCIRCLWLYGVGVVVAKVVQALQQGLVAVEALPWESLMWCPVNYCQLSP